MSKYRVERQSDIPQGVDYPVTLTTDKPWENETKGVTWWRWMASLPSANPNKQGDFAQEWIYLNVGSERLNSQLEHAVSEHGYEDGNRVKTDLVIVRTGKDEWDVSVSDSPGSDSNSNSQAGGKGRQGGNSKGRQFNRAQSAGDVKMLADLVCMGAAYAARSLRQLGHELDGAGAVEAGKFIAMQVVTGDADCNETLSLLRDAAEVSDFFGMRASDFEPASDEDEEDDELPF